MISERVAAYFWVAIAALSALLPARHARAAEDTAANGQTAAEARAAIASAENELLAYKPLWQQRPIGSYEAEWDVIGLGESRTRTVVTTGWGVSLTPWIPELAPTLRLANVNLLLLAGDFGDTQYDAFHIQLGHDPRVSILEATAIEVTVGTRFRWTRTGVGQRRFSGPELLVDTSRKFSERDSLTFGGGFGARLLEGALTVELMGEAVYAVNNPFLGYDEEPGSDRIRWKPRVGLTVKTDLCFQLGANDRRCYYEPTAQRNVDLSHVLARALARVESQPSPALLCAAADEGVRLSRSGAADRCTGLDAEAFFCRASQALSETPVLRERLRSVWEAHHELQTCYRDQRDRETSARAANRQRSIRLQYGAYPAEMRRSLGCDPNRDDPTALATKRQIEAEDEAVEEGCRLCPRACPASANWTPKD